MKQYKIICKKQRIQQKKGEKKIFKGAERQNLNSLEKEDFTISFEMI